MYNFNKIVVNNCAFEHNGPSSVVKFSQFRGHSGGLSISLLSYPVYQEHSIIVKDSTFLSNSALPDESTRQSSSEVLKDMTFTGRGGALGLFLGDDTSSIQAEMTNCSFHENFAHSLGGALYAAFSHMSNHTLMVKDCFFMNNNCSFSGGALLVGFVGIGFADRHSFVTVLNTMFVENYAVQGGGAVIILPGYQGLLLI